MKWGVWAIPPATGIFSDLLPRFQVWSDGRIVEYNSKEAAEEWAIECRTCPITKWKYEVKEIGYR